MKVCPFFPGCSPLHRVQGSSVHGAGIGHCNGLLNFSYHQDPSQHLSHLLSADRLDRVPDWAVGGHHWLGRQVKGVVSAFHTLGTEEYVSKSWLNLPPSQPSHLNLPDRCCLQQLGKHKLWKVWWQLLNSMQPTHTYLGPPLELLQMSGIGCLSCFSLTHCQLRFLGQTTA